MSQSVSHSQKPCVQVSDSPLTTSGAQETRPSQNDQSTITLPRRISTRSSSYIALKFPNMPQGFEAFQSRKTYRTFRSHLKALYPQAPSRTKIERAWNTLICQKYKEWNPDPNQIGAKAKLLAFGNAISYGKREKSITRRSRREVAELLEMSQKQKEGEEMSGGKGFEILPQMSPMDGVGLNLNGVRGSA